MTEIATIVEPTADRRAKGPFDGPEVSRSKQRRAWRSISIIEALFNENKIGSGELAAFERFEADWAKATHVPSPVAAYGDRIAAGGESDDNGEVARIAAANRVKRAVSAIGTPYAIRAVHMAIVGNEQGRPNTIVEIGRAVSAYNDRQASAAATVIIREALCRLQRHYDKGG